ncbi:carboxypeptidase regulatory-like domain-containing protein [Blastochloris sulfoviridis]|nr:carboxypeptidase regulatory-like domain-containing protein [Blastochloris sulfoviridis]
MVDVHLQCRQRAEAARESAAAGRAALRPAVPIWHRLLRGLVALLIALVLGLPVQAQTPPPSEAERREMLVKLLGTGHMEASSHAKVARLLLRMRYDQSFGADRFFKELAAADAGMKEVREVRTLLEAKGLSEAFLGKRYPEGGTPVEQSLLMYRRQVTEQVYREVLRLPRPAGMANGTVWLARVGKWVTQDGRAMTFDGDIDFSFITADTRVAQWLKDQFDARLRSRLGPAAAAHGADAVATAHGRADREVYHGDAGQKFAEEMMKGVERVDREGNLHREPVAAMQARLAEEKALVQEMEARLPDIRHSTDPGLSMEMARHLVHDIKGSREYPPAVLIVKAAKYAERNADSAVAAGDKMDLDFTRKAAALVFLSQQPDAATLRDAIVEGHGNNGKVDQAAADAFIARAEESMWRAVEASIHRQADALEARRADIESARSTEREAALTDFRREVVRLHDTLEMEKVALHDIEIPDFVATEIARVAALVDALRKFGRPITEAEMRQKKLVEALVKGNTPSGLKIAAAQIYLWAGEGFDTLNSGLDLFDDALLGRLRGDRDFDSFLAEVRETKSKLASTDPKTAAAAKLRLTAIAQGAQHRIATINHALNDLIQSRAIGRGAAKGLVAIGLADELSAYGTAFYERDWSGLSAEILRRRVPFVSSAERAANAENASDYVMAGVDVVTTIIPPLGMAQAAIGMGQVAAEMGVTFYWNDQLGRFVEEVYAGARFKPTASGRQGAAVVADWRLASVTYRGKTYDLHGFAGHRRDQIKLMAAELRKPRRTRDIAAPMFGDRDGLTDQFGVDKTLRANLAAADPLLRMLEELRGRPQVGEKLEQHFRDQVRVRWEEVKRAWLVETIDRLETRWATEWAQRAGQLPALFAELRRVTTELEIADEVLRSIDARLPAGSRALIALHGDTARDTEIKDYFLEPDDAPRTAELARVIMDTLETYRGVREVRATLEQMLGLANTRDGGLRLLTGIPYLTGTAADDDRAARTWLANVQRLDERGTSELRAIKARHVGARAALDSDFDRDARMKLWRIDTWRYSWASAQRDGKTLLPVRGLDDPATATARLDAARKALLAAFEEHYLSGVGTLEVQVREAGGGGPVAGARVSFGRYETRAGRDGAAQITGIVPGRYQLKVEAPGYRPEVRSNLGFPAGEGARNRLAMTVEIAKGAADPTTPGPSKPDGKAPVTKPDTAKLNAGKPDAAKPTTASDPRSQSATDGSRPTTAPDPTDPVTGADPKTWTDWRAALAARTAARQRNDRAMLEAAEQRTDAFWFAEKAVLDGLWAHLTRYREDVERIYAGFLAAAPAPKPVHSGAGTVTDLDGEVPMTTVPCRTALEQQRDAQLAAIRAFADRVYATDNAFDERRIAVNRHRDDNYSDAMQRAEALWSGTPLVPRAWNTTPLKTAISDPCSGRTATASVAAPTTPPSATGPSAPPLTAALRLDAAGTAAGDIAVLAEAKGGAAPYRYRWTGARSATDARALYTAPNAPGAEAVVTVTDSSGATATARIALPVAALTLELVRAGPAGPVAAGRPVPFEARLTREGKPVSAADIVLRWEPAAGARFAKAEGPGVVANTAIFMRTGRAKVWVVALRREGGVLATAAESNQVELDIVAAEVALRVEPPSPRVGETVTVTARETPHLPDADVGWWWEIEGAAQNAGAAADPRIYSFIPKDATPVTVTAHAKARMHGEELARGSVTVTPAPYQVGVVTLGPAFEASTARPVIWRPGKGLETLPPTALAPFQDIAFRADIAPAPPGEAARLRYAWTVNDGTTLSGNPATRQTRAQRADAGAIEVSVEVRDAEGILLGTGSASVTVAVSAADLATGRQKSAELTQMTREAEATWAAGETDAACDKAQAARAIQPTYGNATSFCEGRDRIRTLVREVGATLAKIPTQPSLDEARAKLASAKAVNTKVAALADLERRLNEAAGRLAGSEARKEVRDRQLALLLSGAKACVANNWRQCRDEVSAGLANARNVFEPADAPLLDKARALLAKADAGLKGAPTAPKPMPNIDTGSDRQRRLDLLLAGAQACNRQVWTDCRRKLTAALDGGERVFLPTDRPLLDKARALLAKAEAALVAAKPNDTTGDARNSALASPAPPVAAPTPAGVDGVYRGTLFGLGAGPRALTFAVAGARITMVRDKIDAPGKGHAGTVAPTGEFAIEFPNNVYRGRISGRQIAGTWRMQAGVLGGAGSSGRFEAAR